MRLSIIGVIVTDFNFIMVALFPRYVPGGYWFLVVGPMLQGAFGGTLSCCPSPEFEEMKL
jgi:hypothetical protein